MKSAKIALILILVALVSIVIGVVSGQQAAVFEKASRICMECIGLG